MDIKLVGGEIETLKVMEPIIFCLISPSYGVFLATLTNIFESNGDFNVLDKLFNVGVIWGNVPNLNSFIFKLLGGKLSATGDKESFFIWI